MKQRRLRTVLRRNEATTRRLFERQLYILATDLPLRRDYREAKLKCGREYVLR
jgi:hypothetical protein